jgi:uncharacterized delta-60 repeat protein
LSNPGLAILGTPSETVVDIVDNDAGIELEASELIVRENVGQTALVVHRSSDGPETITVDYTTMAGTAIDGVDYVGKSGTLIFLPAEWTKTVVVPIHFNPEFEGRESFRFVLSNPSSSAGLGAKSATTVFIDDQDSSFEFGPLYPNWENGSALCYVLRRGFMTETATVRVRSDGGTATAGQDYLPVDTILTFAPNENSQSFYVTNLNDGLVEPLETIHLSLSEPSGLSILVSPADTNVVIFDNDQGIEFTAPRFYVNEFSTQAVAFVHRGDDGTNTLTVRYSTSDEGALAGADYLPRSGVLTLPPSTNGYDQVNVPIFVPVLTDRLLETNETIRLTLSQPGPLGTLGTQDVTRIVILDDERAGSLDLTYHVDPNDFSPNSLYGPIRLAPHSGQKLLVGSYQSLNRLLPNGQADPSFTAQSLFYFSPVALQRPDGKILAGGSSSNDFFGGSLCLQLLESNGTPNASFNFSIREGRTAAIALQSDGRILIGGSFTTQPLVSESRSILRVLPSGALDPTFEAGESTPVTGYYGFPSTVEAVVIQPDGRILVAGVFVTMGGQPSYKIARLLASGSLDPSFRGPSVRGALFPEPNPQDSYFAAMALQADGRIMVGGSFTNIGGKTVYNLARYNPDGSIDPSFASPLTFDQPVTALTMQSDGKLLIAATRYNWLTFTTESQVYRLLSDGTVDPAFDAGRPPNGAINSLVLMPGGDIAIGGSFTEVNGIPSSLVARLKGDGLYLRAQRSAPNSVLIELFNTTPGSTNVMEGSADLLNWLPMQTNIASSASQTWNVPATGAYRYFRVKNVGP